jgi:hypothetical protein
MRARAASARAPLDEMITQPSPLLFRAGAGAGAGCGVRFSAQPTGESYYSTS